MPSGAKKESTAKAGLSGEPEVKANSFRINYGDLDAEESDENTRSAAAIPLAMSSEPLGVVTPVSPEDFDLTPKSKSPRQSWKDPSAPTGTSGTETFCC